MNRNNLQKYLHWFKTNIVGDGTKLFDMRFFTQGDLFSKDPKEISAVCCCALGWAPLCFGIEESDYFDVSSYFWRRKRRDAGVRRRDTALFRR